MSVANTADSVDRLKELLFDSEQRALDALANRLDAVAAQTEAHAQKEQDLRTLIVGDIDGLANRIEDLHAKVGGPAQLRSSVAGIIDGALSDAEFANHAELTKAVAPLVVRTIRSEIRNSQDEMVEALYPVTGRMVQAYVASAMRDLMEQVNRRLESNWVMLGLRSLATGRSPAELALAESQRLGVEEVYLIRRFRGELIGHWPKSLGEGREQVLGGVLAAINEFTNEAFQAEGSSLRQVDLGQSKLYLRASPTYLLAVRTSGHAPATVEQDIDAEFLATLEHHRVALADDGAPEPTMLTTVAPSAGVSPMAAAMAGTSLAVAHMRASAPAVLAPALLNPAVLAPESPAEILGELYDHLNRRIEATQNKLTAPPFGLTPLRLLGLVVGLPLLLLAIWLGQGWYDTYQARAAAAEVLEASDAVKGYPIAIDVSNRGRTVTLTGLVPSLVAKSDLDARLKQRLALAEVRDEMTVVASSPDAGPAIASVRRDLAVQAEAMNRLSVRRTLERAIRRLGQAEPGLGALQSAVAKAGGDTAPVAAAALTVTEAVGDLNAERARLLAPAGPGQINGKESKDQSLPELRDVAHRLALAGAGVSGLLGGAGNAAVSMPLTPKGDLADSAEEVAAEAERLSAIVIATAGAYPLSQRQPAEPVTILQPAPAAVPDPRALLEAWTRSHAVFFAEKAEYRDPSRASATLRDLAGLMAKTDAFIRIVGYTDEVGQVARNASVSQERADRVLADLVQAGVVKSRIVAIGRKSSADISPQTGPLSPNRRVEFEIGFAGESGGE